MQDSFSSSLVLEKFSRILLHTVLQLVQEGGYKGLYVGKYQTIQLIYVSFTFCKACLNFKWKFKAASKEHVFHGANRDVYGWVNLEIPVGGTSGNVEQVVEW